MDLRYEIEGGNFTAAGYASSQVKKILKQIGLNSKVIKSIVVAMYEAELNVVAHAFEGTIDVKIEAVKITITVRDKGPGIADIELAMTEGFSTASKKVREMGFGAGMGLPNIKRNMDKLEVESEVGKGTKLTMIKYIT